MLSVLNKNEILRLIISKDNKENKMICVEELAELQIAITKLERGRQDNDNLIEEMADVYIVLAMLEQLYFIDKQVLEKEIKRKMDRNLSRIGDKNER